MLTKEHASGAFGVSSCAVAPNQKTLIYRQFPGKDAISKEE